MARRNTVPRRFAAFSLALAACTGPAALAPPVAVEDQLASLQSETGHPWSMRVGPLGTPTLLEGQTAPLGTTPTDAVRATRTFIDDHPALFRITSSALATLTSTTETDGWTHASFQQRDGNVPVWGSELLAHFDRTGALVRINGHYGPIAEPPTLVPVLTDDHARVIAAMLARFVRPTLDASSISTTTPDLVLWPDDDDVTPDAPRRATLAWHVEADGVETTSLAPLELETFVDATTGQVLAARDLLRHMEGSGLGVFGDRKVLSVTEKSTGYWLEDPERGDDTPSRTFSASGKNKLPGSELRSSEADMWDVMPDHGTAGSAVDAHAYLGTTWDWFLRTQGRAGWAGDGAGVRAVVHYGESYGDAFFDGKQLVFGDGDASMTAPSAALDLVAHEYAHGVIAATAGLEPTGEPAEVAEGLADVFACLVSYDSGQGSIWQIGEVVFHPARSRHNEPMRDLADPRATGQPLTLAEVDRNEKDPHVAASIVGHLGYVLTEGSVYGVQALGPELVGHLFHRATATYLFPRAGFDDLANALLAATRDLAPDAEGNVMQALIEVGLR